MYFYVFCNNVDEIIKMVIDYDSIIWFTKIFENLRRTIDIYYFFEKCCLLKKYDLIEILIKYINPYFYIDRWLDYVDNKILDIIKSLRVPNLIEIPDISNITLYYEEYSKVIKNNNNPNYSIIYILIIFNSLDKNQSIKYIHRPIINSEIIQSSLFMLLKRTNNTMLKDNILSENLGMFGNYLDFLN